MKYETTKAGIVLAKAASVLMWNQFRYPQPVKGRYQVATNRLEKLKWAYRCWVRQLEVAEKGSGLETYFRNQNLQFTLPEDFRPEARLTVTAGGDLMAVDCFTYEDTAHLFDGIRDFYFQDAFTCANLETNLCPTAPIGRNQMIGYPPKMNTSEGMMDRFQEDGLGIDYFSTANNHCYDYGEQGLLDTLDCLDRRGALHSGTNRTPAEQEDVLVVERNGIKIALLSYTCDMNGNEYEKKHLINEVRFNDEAPDFSLVERHVARAREKGADCIIASVHWGWEFEMYPHKNIVEAGHKLAELGVDVVLGSHPHVSQPMERYRTADGKQHLIIYSLGDFVSYHPLSRNSKLTYIVRFDLAKGTAETGVPAVHISDLKVKPVYILCQELEGDRYDCRLLPFFEVLYDKENRYRLTDEERKDLPRLEQIVWRQILMPQNPGDLIVP